MELNNYKFFCPHCDHHLDESGEIHLHTLRKNGDEGEMFLSTSFGSYSFTHVPPIVFLKNEYVSFSCPACHVNLDANDYPNYILLKMKVEGQFDFELLFSKKAGIHKTYIITEDGIEQYGEHASKKNLK